jgi:hypothetical protein
LTAYLLLALQSRIFDLFCISSLQPLIYLGRAHKLEGEFMQTRKAKAMLLASALTISMSAGLALAQDVATDTKKAADKTADGTKTVAHKTASGTKTAADKTADGTKTVAHKTASGTKTAADKTVDGTKTVGKDIGHGTKTAATDTAHGTEKLGDKIAGKPTPQ